MKLRVCLDTSVFSAYYDTREVDRQALTEELWDRLDEFEVSTSDLTLIELAQAPDENLRDKFEKMLEGITILPLTEEISELAQRYINSGIFSPRIFNDALHVATAVLNRQDILLSWNFRHLVNRRRRAQVNEVNTSLGLPTIEIIAPPEI